MLRGLDASAVQGAIPFKQLVADDFRFFIAKGAQGNDGFDPWCWRNVQSAIENGIVPGIYHFTYPLPKLDPRQQAQLFFERSKGFGASKGELPPFLDFEWPPPIGKDGKKGWKEWGCSPQQISDWQAANCEEVRRLFGVKPILYTYPWFFQCIRDGVPGLYKGADVSWVTDYPLWLASYVKQWPTEGTTPPNLPKPWTTWFFHQWDGDGGLRLPNGVDADFDVFNGTEEDLQLLASHVSIPTPPIEEQSIVRNNDEMIEEYTNRYRDSIFKRIFG